MSEYTYYLAHHGIRGQKWGVRRFQNKDGTRTEAGRKRERQPMSDSTKKKIIAATIGAATLAAGAAYAVKNPKSTKLLLMKAELAGLKATHKTLSVLSSDTTKNFVKNVGTKTAKSFGEGFVKAGKAMTDAAILSIGAISVNKLADRLAAKSDDSESVKNTKQVILDAGTAGIKSLSGVGSGGNNSKKNGNGSGNIGKDIADKVGSPSKKGVDKQSKAWQDLFKDSNGNNRSSDEKDMIRSMASAGYDIDQINKYLNHSLSLSDENFYISNAIGRMYAMSVL